MEEEYRGANWRVTPTAPLILASGSQARAQVLEKLGIEFRVIPSNSDESILKDELPRVYVSRVAQQKAHDVAQEHPQAYVLGADTIVAVGRRILRKAEDADEAAQQMALLSGRRHRVYTGVALIAPSGKVRSRVVVAHVGVKRLTAQEIALFVFREQWKNVAVYRLRELFGFFTTSLRGQESTVLGLPMCETYQLLVGAGCIRITNDVSKQL